MEVCGGITALHERKKWKMRCNDMHFCINLGVSFTHHLMRPGWEEKKNKKLYNTQLWCNYDFDYYLAVNIKEDIFENYTFKIINQINTYSVRQVVQVTPPAAAAFIKALLTTKTLH